jgi:putative PEP-CTERM system TPR-repeat lipoprotein
MYYSALILIIAVLIGGCSGPITPQENVKKAKAAAAKKHYSEAIIFYKNALKEEPSFIEARFELGVLYYALGDNVAAERFLLNVYDAGYAPEKVVLLLASTYFQQNDTTALKQLLSEQKAVKPSTAFSLHLALYDILLLSRMNQVVQAEKTFNELLASLDSPAQECALCQLTQAHLQSYNSPTSAINTLDKLVGKEPQNAQAYLLRGQLYFALRNHAAAMENFEHFQHLQPRASYAHFLLATTALLMKEPANASKYVDTLLSAHPRQSLANHLKALLVFEQKNYPAAQAYAEQSMASGLKSPANLLIAGVSAYHQEQMEVAYGHLSKAVVYYPKNAQLKRLVMLIQVKFGYLTEASENYLTQDMSSVEDLLFGNAMAQQLLQAGQFDEADSILAYLHNMPVTQPVIRLQTQALQKQLGLGEVLPTQKKPLQVQDMNSDENLFQIILLLEGNALEEAKNQAQKWLGKAPENIDALNVLGYIFQQLKQTAKAKVFFKRALDIDPQNTPSLFFFAKEALSQSEHQQASVHYQTILALDPTNLAALRGLLQLTFTSQQAPNWEKLLKAIEHKTVSDDQIVAITDAMFRWQQYQKLDSFISMVGPQTQWSDMVWMIWLKNAYFVHGARKFQHNFATFFEKNTLPMHVLFALSILEKQREFSLLLKTIQYLPEPMRHIDAVQMQKALALVEVKRFDEVNPILNALASKPEFRTATWYIKGKLMESSGDLTQAASYLSSYYESQPSFHSVSSLASVLIKANRNEDVVSLTNDYLSNNPADSSARLSLALKLAQTNPVLALKLFQSEDVQWLVWRNWKLSSNLAWLYLSQQDPANAVRYSTNALALNPANVQVKIVHANILIALKRDAEGRKLLQSIDKIDGGKSRQI